ncbi:hypothetical protein QE386_002893 [Pseudoxanthomonas winnipegensis]|nr:hypothetical protein [Pseudoxanthomonas winnipegensis]
MGKAPAERAPLYRRRSDAALWHSTRTHRTRVPPRTTPRPPCRAELAPLSFDQIMGKAPAERAPLYRRRSGAALWHSARTHRIRVPPRTTSRPACRAELAPLPFDQIIGEAPAERAPLYKRRSDAALWHSTRTHRIRAPPRTTPRPACRAELAPLPFDRIIGKAPAERAPLPFDQIIGEAPAERAPLYRRRSDAVLSLPQGRIAPTLRPIEHKKNKKRSTRGGHRPHAA